MRSKNQLSHYYLNLEAKDKGKNEIENLVKASLLSKTFQDLSDVESVNISTDSSCIVSFVPGHQILAIPQVELLTRAYRVRREKRQDNLRGERVISGNL